MIFSIGYVFIPPYILKYKQYEYFYSIRYKGIMQYESMIAFVMMFIGFIAATAGIVMTWGKYSMVAAVGLLLMVIGVMIHLALVDHKNISL